MHRRPPSRQAIRGLASLAVAAVVAVVAAGPASPAPSHRGLEPPTPGAVSVGEFRSTAVAGVLHYAIFVPRDYATSGKRYPVVYFLHGLPASPDAYRSIGGLGESLAKTGSEAIVVGAQGARKGDTDPEWHDWGPGRNWETATQTELVRWIDAHYRTIPTRAARAIVGISGGGYGAMLIGIRHPETYSVVQSWSGYFRATDPTGEKPIDLGGALATKLGNGHFYATNPTAFMRYLKGHDKPYKPLRFGFYIGNRDTLFLAENTLFDKELSAAGISHVFRIYPGAHTHAFWAAHRDEWLSMAVRQLAPAHRP
jgi:S-formylglutathione hydrolase FrmB